MDFNQVRIGYRCWVPSKSAKCDMQGQNATVDQIDRAEQSCELIGDDGIRYINRHPGYSLFWRMPEIPERPKKKVVYTCVGFLTDVGLQDVKSGTNVTLWKESGSGSTGTRKHPATISVTVEE